MSERYASLQTLPVAQLESLKFKANQIIESIQSLQWTIDAGGNPAAMPTWLDILSKYNILLSQTHSFSNSLLTPFPSQSARNAQNIYERIALHPAIALSDTQLDTEVIPLLRNQQTTDVLRMENDTVRRLSEHMKTRGSLGVLGAAPHAPRGLVPHKKPEYEDVLRECAEIREAHDHRVDRAVRAVAMLRDKYDWKQRVEVEVEEPEELEWDPRMGRTGLPLAADEDIGMESPEEEDRGSSDEDEENVQGELVPSTPDIAEILHPAPGA